MGGGEQAVEQLEEAPTATVYVKDRAAKEVELAEELVNASGFRILSLKRERSKLHVARGRLRGLGKAHCLPPSFCCPFAVLSLCLCGRLRGLGARALRFSALQGPPPPTYPRHPPIAPPLLKSVAGRSQRRFPGLWPSARRWTRAATGTTTTRPSSRLGSSRTRGSRCPPGRATKEMMQPCLPT